MEEYQLPLEIRGELRPYQRAGIAWLAFLRRCGLHGVLADDMGLGKTLQTTAIIAGGASEDLPMRACSNTRDGMLSNPAFNVFGMSLHSLLAY